MDVAKYLDGMEQNALEKMDIEILNRAVHEALDDPSIKEKMEQYKAELKTKLIKNLLLTLGPKPVEEEKLWKTNERPKTVDRSSRGR